MHEHHEMALRDVLKSNANILDAYSSDKFEKALEDQEQAAYFSEEMVRYDNSGAQLLGFNDEE